METELLNFNMLLFFSRHAGFALTGDMLACLRESFSRDVFAKAFRKPSSLARVVMICFAFKQTWAYAPVELN